VSQVIWILVKQRIPGATRRRTLDVNATEIAKATYACLCHRCRHSTTTKTLKLGLGREAIETPPQSQQFSRAFLSLRLDHASAASRRVRSRTRLV